MESLVFVNDINLRFPSPLHPSQKCSAHFPPPGFRESLAESETSCKTPGSLSIVPCALPLSNEATSSSWATRSAEERHRIISWGLGDGSRGHEGGVLTCIKFRKKKRHLDFGVSSIYAQLSWIVISRVVWCTTTSVAKIGSYSDWKRLMIQAASRLRASTLGYHR